MPTARNLGDGRRTIARRDLLRQLAERSGLTVPQVQLLLRNLKNAAVTEVSASGSFEVPGLVRFTLRDRPPRRVVTGGTERHLPARRALVAKPVKTMRDRFYSLIE